MGFFSDMPFWEKVAFVVALPVIGPVAVVQSTYEKVVDGKPFFDSDTPNNQDEQEERERVERQAKEKQAEEARQAIISYTTNGLIALQKMHSTTDQPVPASLSFTQLRKIVQGNQQSVEILTHLLPNASGSAAASAAQKKAYLLNEEIQDLKRLRQTIIDMKTSKVKA